MNGTWNGPVATTTCWARIPHSRSRPRSRRRCAKAPDLGVEPHGELELGRVIAKEVGDVVLARVGVRR